jgi:hypothetical protein
VEDHGTIEVLVSEEERPTPWWITLIMKVIKMVLGVVGSGIIVSIYYGIVIQVFPGLPEHGILPPTINLVQGIMLAFGLFGISAAIRLLGKIFE